jgi:iron complex transport system substrate-binding protein
MLLGGCQSGRVPVPGKIVSNNPCVDAVLAEIAEPNVIGAVSSYSQVSGSASAPLAWARQFPAIGSGAEDIIAAKPRLALIGQYGAVAALDRAGINYVAFGVPATIEESIAQVRAIGKLTGREASAGRLARRIDDAAKVIVSRRPRSAIIWLSGGFVPGGGTLQDAMLGRAGFQNASAHYGLTAWSVLPLEALLKDPPDVIFTPVKAQGADARALGLRFRLLEKLSKRPQIVPFSETLLNCGGPSIIEVMSLLRGAA